MKKICLLMVLIVWVSCLSGQDHFNVALVSQTIHPFETNDVWGYVDSTGREYAITGTQQDCRIYDLTDPSSPELVKIIPGASSIWRDYKYYGNFIYQITQRGRDGLTIIDMSLAPDSIRSKTFTPFLRVGNDEKGLNTCHNIWIDTIKGHAYASGCDIGQGGVLIFDLKDDPWNPTLIGAVDERYSHDVITRGDTLFSSEINEGNLGIYNVSDPANPTLISRTQTSSFFTHNAWYSDDGNFVFTTDERPNSNVDAYDIRDIESPIRIDQYRPKQGGGVIPHNTHYKDGFLVTSWYTEGVIIIDAHRPDNLIKVGQYDTYAPDGNGFNGCWGAYPYLPSGNILASDLSGGLFVLSPNYVRASYLEGTLSDAQNGSPISLGQIRLDDVDNTIATSDALGVFKTGTGISGTYTATFSHPDYETQTIQVVLIEGEVIDLDVRLFRKDSILVVLGKVIDRDGHPIPNASVLIQNIQRKETAISDQNGNYKAFLPSGNYEILAAAWGYRGRKIESFIETQTIDDIELVEGYEDDFFTDLGWTVNDDAARGNWVRQVPVGTFFNGKTANPDADLPDDLGNFAYITGNNTGSLRSDDVDEGTTTLTSPDIDVSAFKNAIIEITPWFFNDGGRETPNDSLNIYLIANETKVLIKTIKDTSRVSGRWLDPVQIYVDSIFKRDKTVKIAIEASDDEASGHLVEAGIDKFRLYEGPLPTYPPNQEIIELVVSPNPSTGIIYVEPKTNEAMLRLYIFDVEGRRVRYIENPETEINVANLTPGLYVIDVLFSSGKTGQFKLVKM